MQKSSNGQEEDLVKCVENLHQAILRIYKRSNAVDPMPKKIFSHSAGVVIDVNTIRVSNRLRVLMDFPLVGNRDFPGEQI